MSRRASYEFEQAQYTLRASFYYRSHQIWDRLSELLAAQNHHRDWTAADALGVSERAARRVKALGIPLSKVFAHPDLTP